VAKSKTVTKEVTPIPAEQKLKRIEHAESHVIECEKAVADARQTLKENKQELRDALEALRATISDQQQYIEYPE